LTSRRAAFAGSGRVPALAWHAVRQVVQAGRDVLFVPATGEHAIRFRCNSFADAVCGAAIARFLIQHRRGPVEPLTVLGHRLTVNGTRWQGAADWSGCWMVPTPP